MWSNFVDCRLLDATELLFQAVHGFTTSVPQSSKSLMLRVARLAPLDRAMATIMASNWLIGLPAADMYADLCLAT